MNRQGKVDVLAGDNGDLFVCLPDGTIEVCCDTKTAYNKAQTWFKTHMDKSMVNVGTIDWHHGLQPPILPDKE